MMLESRGVVQLVWLQRRTVRALAFPKVDWAPVVWQTPWKKWRTQQ